MLLLLLFQIRMIKFIWSDGDRRLRQQLARRGIV